MAEDTTPKPEQDFFASVNEYLDVTRKQSTESGPQRPSVASMFAAARFNAYVFIGTVPPNSVADHRTAWLDHTTALFRRMLNENLDGLGREHNVDVGVSELPQGGAVVADAAGVEAPAAEPSAPTSAADYVAAAGAMPPSSDPQAR